MAPSGKEHTWHPDLGLWSHSQQQGPGLLGEMADARVGEGNIRAASQPILSIQSVGSARKAEQWGLCQRDRCQLKAPGG